MKKFAPKKILIIKPSSLGDIVHSLPALDALYRCFPGAAIHWLVAKGFEGILEGHPMINRLWIVRKDEWKRITRLGSTISELRELFRNLRGERFDCAIDLQGLFRSGLIAKATGARMRVGFAEAREGSVVFYTHKVAGGRDIHAVDRYLKIPSFLGCGTDEVRFPMIPCRVAPGNALPAEVEYAVMAPGARKPANRWPARSFGELAARLPLKTVVVGSKGDRSLAAEVVKASEGKAVSIAGETGFKELIGVIGNARLLVSNDTGPMHVAAALGVPVFALFGPANPARTGPYGGGHTVIRKEVSCSPCYRKSCKNALCMDMIKVDEVVEIINGFLQRRR
jgi:heptosyltransferase-1